jgi:flagellum-specific ATP synthase
VLTRQLASRGHHPAIDILQSTSRLMTRVATADAQRLALETRQHMAVYEASRDLIELGAHQPGVNVGLDRAVALRPALDAFLQQPPTQATTPADTLRQLASALHPEAQR